MLYPFKLFLGRFEIVYGLPSGQGFDETCQYLGYQLRENLGGHKEIQC